MILIEKTLKDYLGKVSSHVFMGYPQKPPDEFIIVEKVGGSENNFLAVAQIAIQSYGISLYDAAVLNNKVKAAMRDLITLNSISRCKLNSDYNFTDTSMKRYRYQALYDIYYYEEE